MSKASLTKVLLLCAAVTACSDDRGTTSLSTAPMSRLSLSEAPSDLIGGTTMDGPFDLVLASEAPLAQMAASAAAATGSRAGGHVGFNFAAPTIGLAAEQYSFTALSTDPSTPFAAKGQYELILTSATSGAEQRFHGEVICMSIVGNTARIAGQITKVWINNVQVPVRPTASHNIWTVTDNGEGTAVDQASPMIFFPAPGAQFHCATGFLPPLFPVQQGNVQVQP